MIKTREKTWALPAACGVFNAILAVIYLSHTLNGFHALQWVAILGDLTLAAGMCAIAAGIWNSARSRGWLLMLNGLACSMLGSILTFWRGPIAFRAVALFIMAMAIGLGAHQLAVARLLRDRRAAKWFFTATGWVSLGFAVVFLAFAARWIALDPESPGQTLVWLGAFFAFTALCMVGLALRPASGLLHSGGNGLPCVGKSAAAGGLL